MKLPFGYKIEKATAPKAPQRPMGLVGLKVASGFVQEEFLTELQWPQAGKVYQEMASNDAVIGGCLYLIETLIRKAHWHAKAASDEPGDLEAATFLESCMYDMQDQSWDDFVCDVLSMLTYGFSFHEIVYKVRRGPLEKDPKFKSNYTDGKIGWQELPVRSQASLSEWTYDETTGKVTEFVQDPSIVGVKGELAKIPIEGNLLFKTKSARGNPEGWSILRRAYRCFDAATDILTDKGWKSIVELTRQDRVATLNKQTGYIEYEQPKALNVYPYSGDMIRIQTKYLDQLVTPNHRMFVKKCGAAGYSFVDAANISAQQHMLRGAKWEGSAQEVYRVATHGVQGATEKAVDMYTWASFMGLFLADGFTCCAAADKQHYVGITQKAGNRCNVIRELLNKLPYSYSEHELKNDMVSFEIYDKALCLDVLPYSITASEKHIPEYIKCANKDILSTFVAWYWFGDGSVSGASEAYAGTLTISTISRRMADDLQEIALKIDHAGTMWSRDQANSFGSNPLYFVSFSEVLECKVGTVFTEKYTGYVYCPTTENGVVYVRRNGKACWSGNSWYFKRYIEELEGIGIERNLAGIPTIAPPPDVPLFDKENDEMRTMLDWAQKLVNELRQDRNHGVVLPSTDWELKLLGAEGSSKAMDTDTIIRRHESRMAMSMLSDIVIMGGDRTGSFALAETKQGLFIASLQAIINSIAYCLNTRAVPKLFAVNGWTLEKLPTIVADDLKAPSISEIALLLRSFKVDITKDKNLFNFILTLMQAPEMTQDQFDAFMAAQSAGNPDNGDGTDPDDPDGEGTKPNPEFQDGADNDAKQSDLSYT